MNPNERLGPEIFGGFKQYESLKAITDVATVSALEQVIAVCKEKRESLMFEPARYRPGPGRPPEFLPIAEQTVRDEGFRGALAWVEGWCCEEINRVRGVLK